jgi:hypothetical protein
MRALFAHPLASSSGISMAMVLFSNVACSPPTLVEAFKMYLKVDAAKQVFSSTIPVLLNASTSDMVSL